MNGVALMVALLTAPDAASFGKWGGGWGGCGCGLFGGRIRSFFHNKFSGGLFAKCRCRGSVWVPPTSCGCGGYDAGGFAGPSPGYDGPPPGPVAGPFPTDGVSFGGVPAFPTAMPGGPFPNAGPSGPVGQPHPSITPSGPSTGWVMPPIGTDPGAIPQVLGSPTPVPGPQASPTPVPTPVPSGARAPAPLSFPPVRSAPVLAGGVTPATAVGGEDFAQARLTFRVPDGATVFVDGQPVGGAGPVRKFHTPVLPRGKTFFYEFRAEVEVNGVKMVEEKLLPVCAGDELGETFAKLSSAVAGK